MKSVMAWIKSRLLIVICCVLIVLFLPAGYVVSGMLNAKIKKRAEDSYQTEQRKLRGRSKVDYNLPAVFQGEDSISDSRAPNARVTAFYERAREERTRQVGEVVKLASEFNAKGRTPLVEGVLPKPADERDMRLVGDFAERISGRRVGDGDLPLMREMLRGIGAGGAVRDDMLAESLYDYREQQREKLEGESPNGRLTPEQEEALDADLRKRRLGAYASRSADVSVYATPEVFQVQIPGGQGFGPLEPDPDSRENTEDDAFAWQFDVWVFEDIIGAIGLANAEGAGVRDSVVKRVESVQLFAFDANEQDGTIYDAPQTHTERKTEKANQVYDVRHGRISAVVSAERLPAFIDALGGSNFISVTGVQLSSVDPWADLQEGYYYGSEPVVRVSMGLECVYLRDWIVPFMPESVRTALGVVIPEDNNAETGG